MKKIIIAILVIVLVAVVLIIKPMTNSNPQTSLRNSLDYYKSLSLETSFPTIVSKIGQPDADIGSGIHVFVYKLASEGEILIGTADAQKLMYVKQKKPDGTVVDLVSQ